MLKDDPERPGEERWGRETGRWNTGPSTPTMKSSGAGSTRPFVSGLVARMRTVIKLMAVVLAAAVVLSFLPEGGGEEPPRPCGAGEGACPDEAEAPARASAPPVTILAGAEVCPSAGYLCHGLGERSGEPRVLRWNDDTSVIRVRIPRPEMEDAARGTRLQQAAARGIRAWHGHPFPLHVDLTDRPGDHDFVIRWAGSGSGRQLGQASTRWVMRAGRAELEVTDFFMVTRSPLDGRKPISERQVELTAAHEMGHALGLPHSDRERDVMFPTNTATRLSSQDYRTMQALYELENGALIEGLSEGGG